MKQNGFEQEELYEETNDDLITEEELKHIHPDLDQKISSSTMK